MKPTFVLAMLTASLLLAPPAAAQAPSMALAAITDGEDVLLMWTDPGADGDGATYNVYYAPDGENFSRIAQVVDESIFEHDDPETGALPTYFVAREEQGTEVARSQQAQTVVTPCPLFIEPTLNPPDPGLRDPIPWLICIVDELTPENDRATTAPPVPIPEPPIRMRGLT